MGIAMFWSTFLGWMPPILFVLFGAFIAFQLLVLVFKVVAFLMDVIPFI